MDGCTKATMTEKIDGYIANARNSNWLQRNKQLMTEYFRTYPSAIKVLEEKLKIVSNINTILILIFEVGIAVDNNVYIYIFQAHRNICPENYTLFYFIHMAGYLDYSTFHKIQSRFYKMPWYRKTHIDACRTYVLRFIEMDRQNFRIDLEKVRRIDDKGTEIETDIAGEHFIERPELLSKFDTISYRSNRIFVINIDNLFDLKDLPYSMGLVYEDAKRSIAKIIDNLEEALLPSERSFSELECFNNLKSRFDYLQKQLATSTRNFYRIDDCKQGALSELKRIIRILKYSKIEFYLISNIGFLNLLAEVIYFNLESGLFERLYYCEKSDLLRWICNLGNKLHAKYIYYHGFSRDPKMYSFKRIIVIQKFIDFAKIAALGR